MHPRAAKLAWLDEALENVTRGPALSRSGVVVRHCRR
jgi:hypothetical protein